MTPEFTVATAINVGLAANNIAQAVLPITTHIVIPSNTITISANISVNATPTHSGADINNMIKHIAEKVALYQILLASIPAGILCLCLLYCLETRHHSASINLNTHIGHVAKLTDSLKAK